MSIIEVDSFNVTGLVVRTTNAEEMNPSTAKIGALWEEFYSQLAPKLSQNSRVFGVYTNYESDHTGSFDVVACSDISDTQKLEGVSDFHINAGNYLVFNGAGEMPQAVIDLWGEIWSYFSSESCKYKRAFVTDFEFYKDKSEIEIFISVEDGV